MHSKIFGEAVKRFNAQDYAGAYAHAKDALKHAPGNWEYLMMSAISGVHAGHRNEALSTLEKLSLEHPKSHVITYNLGYVLDCCGRKDEAAKKYETALKLDPMYFHAAAKLLDLLHASGRCSEAVEICRRFLDKNPSDLMMHHIYAGILNLAGDIKGADEENLTVIKNVSGYTASVSAYAMGSLYRDDVTQDEIFRRHRMWHDLYEVKTKRCEIPSKPSRKNGKFRIGYISPDLKRHSVTFFFEPVLAHHDRSRFEIFCYSDTSRTDAITERLKHLSTQWHDIRDLSDEKVAGLICNDKIDILIDLAGHTGSRLNVLAMKPAPIQMTWIGYPATTGLDAVDYRITDILADTEGQEKFHTEKLLRLPGTFLVFAPPDDAPEIHNAPCLKNGFVTFGSFNSTPKISPSCIRLWSSVLKSVPNSKMVIKNKTANDPFVKSRLLSMFEKEGIAASRVEIRPYMKTLASHLSEYSEVDIALDSYPYNGTTTTCEAMWMGVPTLTLYGKAHHERVGLSLMTAVGLPSFALDSEEKFVAMASKMAADHAMIEKLRLSLRQAMAASPLCDAVSFTKRVDIEFKKLLAEKLGGT